MVKDFSDIISLAKDGKRDILTVVCAQDEEVLQAVEFATKEEIIEPILIGDEVKIREIAKSINIDVDKYQIINIIDPQEAALKAVSLVSSGKADFIMKGLLDTKTILKAVLDKEVGLRSGNLLSHVMVAKVDQVERLLYVTDAGMNVSPNVEQKLQIAENAAKVAHSLGNEMPNVGVICAVEKINPKMEATLNADKLQKLNDEGKVTGFKIGGPFALDNAINVEAAKQKGIKNEIAGKVDIMLVPDIEAGNILYKSIMFLGGGQCASVLMGAKAPVVLTSRADSDETKLNSIALAAIISRNK